MVVSDTDESTPLPPTGNPLKTQLISQFIEERREAEEYGNVRNKNPLDESEPFKRLCMACRRGDVTEVKSLISFEKVNVNAVDRFDYPPLTLASLCGHYDVVKLLLENGAVCERDTFQGERCLYNALNNRIRNLLLQYDYSKSSDPLQPWAAGISSLLARAPLDSTDVTVIAFNSGTSFMSEFRLHKFLLSARSPYFRRKFQVARTHLPSAAETELQRQRIVRTVRLANSMDARAFEMAVKFMYLAEVSDVESEEIMVNIERLSRHLEIPELWDMVMVAEDRKKRRALRQEAVENAQAAIDAWFREFVLERKIVCDSVEEAKKVQVEANNEGYADIVLQADEHPDESENPKTVLYPCHKGMLRSEFFSTMFNSSFREGQKTKDNEPLQVIPIDISPAVMEIVLSFLYSEKAEIPIELALDTLFAAEQLLIDRLKLKASHVISTANEDGLPYSIYDVIRAGWLCRIRKLEEFGAKYIADRLEQYLDDPELAELVAESAERIKERQETDTIEVIDDIRYYLGMRFRQRIGTADEFLGEQYDVEEEDEEAEEEGPVMETIKDQQAFFEKQERLQDELLGKIDELLENLRLDA